MGVALLMAVLKAVCNTPKEDVFAPSVNIKLH
jgi:hypothetical protein